MPFFSIIIPVYNVEPYLRESLDSVLAQTFADWEAICVDDGSTDGSGSILDQYAAKDSRFRIFHQPNAGVSAARNKALDEVHGEWFLFLDGDDILRLDGLELFVPYIKNDQYDGILVHPYIPNWSGGDVPRRKIQTNVLVENATREDLLFGPYAANGFPFSRIYRRCVFGKLRFPVGVKMAEDVYFWLDALCIPARWLILNAEYYLYRRRSDSVCGLKSPNDCEAVLNSVLYACNRISIGMDFGESGARRYIERWPLSPIKYLRVFTARHRELATDAKDAVLDRVREVTGVFGAWPFTKRLHYEMWLIENRLTVLMPLLQFGYEVSALSSVGGRFLRNVRERGIGFALGKLKRRILCRGEYEKGREGK